VRFWAIWILYLDHHCENLSTK